jgi:hypothetical protein
MLIMWKEAEKDKPKIGRNNRPAGTIGIPTNRSGCIPDTVNKDPADKGGNDLPHEVQR